MTIHFYSDSNSTKGLELFSSTGTTSGTKNAGAAFDFAAEVKKLGTRFKGQDNKSGQIEDPNSPKAIEKMKKKTEVKRKKEKAERDAKKASNGMTWGKVQSKLKEYYAKLPDSNVIDIMAGHSPYSDYATIQSNDMGSNAVKIDYRSYIRDHIPEEDKAEFEKVCAAYDELKPQMNDNKYGADNSEFIYEEKSI